jgi:hypothetical protein
MVVLPEHARQRNDFRMIQLARPRIERERDAAWKRCEVVNRAEQESLRTILQKWKGAR